MMWLKYLYFVLDHLWWELITIIFCFLIGYSLIPILTKCTIVLMEGKPVGVDYRKIKQIIENVF